MMSVGWSKPLFFSSSPTLFPILALRHHFIARRVEEPVSFLVVNIVFVANGRCDNAERRRKEMARSAMVRRASHCPAARVFTLD